MLTPAEELGLAGANLDSRVRRAVSQLPDRMRSEVARGLSADARASGLIYEHAGVVDAVRITLRPLLVMPDQLAYLSHVCTRIMDTLKRLPELYFSDAAVRRLLPLDEEERSWLEEAWPALRAGPNPLYGRLDAVCDFTSARWEDSLQFLEPNLSGVGGIHLGPLSEQLVMRDVVPAISALDPELVLELPRDQRDLFLQVLLDHARSIGRPGAALCLIEPKYVHEGPNEQSHLVDYYREQRNIRLLHADPRELTLRGEEVYCEDVRIDVAYRDYEIRDLLELERSEGRRLDAIRALCMQNRIVSSVAGDLDHKSCWELFTDEEIAQRHFSTAERRLLRRHVLWTRLVRDCVTNLPNGRGDLADFIRSHREELVLKPNRAYGGSGVHLGSLVTGSEWDALLEQALAQQNHPHNSWVVQSVATLPVHEFPIVGEDGHAHTEPFYAVMGFAATDHGLGIICRVSQKQVVNVAQRGGLAPVLVAQQPRNLRAPRPAAIDAERARALLREEIRRLKQLDGVLRMLEWDEETYRPSGAEAERASQLAVIETLRHELLSSERLADLIETVGANCSATESFAAELLELKRLRRSALALPPELVSAFAAARSHALAAWEEAFRKDDYALFAGPFEHLLGLMRERAQALRQSEDLYDALLDEHEPGMTRAELAPLLETTGARLRELVPMLAERTRGARRQVTRGAFDADAQSQFCRALLGDMGFDFTRGRLDRSTHPFTLMASENDVRITLRYAAESPVSGIMAALHEGGHGLYDQGFPAALRGTLLAAAPSSGMHECQARLWENHVGRSLSFWRFYFPRLAQCFPQQLAGTDVGAFHAALNVVAPGANRVAADEVTYDLHILLRYELELALLNQDLEVSDLPAAWRERSQHYLGVVPRSDREGCLQDVHWSLGEFGYFPTYTIGNLYAAALVEAYVQSADLDEELSRGELTPLRSWLAKHVYGLGCALRSPAIVQAATGQSLSAEPFFRLLEARFAAFGA